jgi:hypothetical protein
MHFPVQLFFMQSPAWHRFEHAGAQSISTLIFARKSVLARF